MPEPAERLRNLLVEELRAAVSMMIDSAADPDEVTADLDRRLRRLRQSRADLGSAGSAPPADS